MGRVISLGSGENVTPSPRPPHHYVVRLRPDGSYFGGHPRIVYDLFEDVAAEKTPLRDALENLFLTSNITVSFIKVQDKKSTGKVISLPRENQCRVMQGNTPHLITDMDFPIEELQNKWWKIASGQHPKHTDDTIVQNLVNMMQDATYFENAFFLAMERENAANNTINDDFVEATQEALINKDMNIYFIENYKDYINNPQDTKRTFVYRGIHL